MERKAVILIIGKSFKYRQNIVDPWFKSKSWHTHFPWGQPVSKIFYCAPGCKGAHILVDTWLAGCIHKLHSQTSKLPGLSEEKPEYYVSHPQVSSSSCLTSKREIMTAENSSNSMKKVNAASEKKLQRHNTETKTGLENNGKTVFSGKRISPKNLKINVEWIITY